MTTAWNSERIEERVEEAIEKLQRDILLFKNHANERSITHRLAVYLECIFDEWDVDCEYNRIEDDPNNYKRLFLSECDDGFVNVFDNEGSRVYPDIIIHHRGTNTPDDNLLVVEVKLAWSERPDDRDLRKLEAFTGQTPVDQMTFYQFGIFLKFDERGEVIDKKILELHR